MLYFPGVSVYLLYDFYARIRQNPDASFSLINRSGHRLQDIRQGENWLCNLDFIVCLDLSGMGCTTRSLIF